MKTELVQFIKKIYGNKEFTPLHAPVFLGNEKEYLSRCIDTTYVSYVGEFVAKFEEETAKFTNSKYAIAVVNGTVALQIALEVAGVKINDEIITQPLTFVATANAISHCGAVPVFVDVDLDTMGMSPGKLEEFLTINCELTSNGCFNKTTGRIVKAIVPMHTFGHPCKIDLILEIANRYNLLVIEDSAESLGSFYKGKHTGTFGLAGILSYNGNKTITTGGGGMIITNDENFAIKAKHITTTAKIPHKWEYVHDRIGYNYRLTNLNAAVGVAQMEYLDKIIINKRETATEYKNFLDGTSITFYNEPTNCISNFWLNAVLFKDINEREEFLNISNTKGVMTRPIWRLMNKLEMFNKSMCGDLSNSLWFEERIVNIPSSFRKLI